MRVSIPNVVGGFRGTTDSVKPNTMSLQREDAWHMLQQLGKRTDGMLLPTENPLQCHESVDEINHHHEPVMGCLSAAVVSPQQYNCIPSSVFSLHTLKQILGWWTLLTGWRCTHLPSYHEEMPAFWRTQQPYAKQAELSWTNQIHTTGQIYSSCSSINHPWQLKQPYLHFIWKF